MKNINSNNNNNNNILCDINNNLLLCYNLIPIDEMITKSILP